MANTETNSPKALLLIQSFIPWLCWILSVFPLLVLAYLGTFTRYLADDYSTSGVLVNMGFWKAQYYWYQNFQGCFSYTFLVSLVELAGVQIVPWLPITALFLSGGALYYTLLQLFNILELQISKIWIGILVNIIIFSTIKGLPEYSQVIFWQTGILSYQISIFFITFTAGVFLKRLYLSNRRPLAGWEYGIWFLAVFIGGGFSETAVIVQITLIGLALFTFALAKNSPVRNDALRMLFLGFLASWAALLIIAKAPGNMNRDTVMAELSFGLFRYAIVNSFWDVNQFLLEWLGGNTLLILMLFLAGLSVGFSRPQLEKATNHLFLGLALLLWAYISLWAGFAPHFAVMGNRPPDRAIFTPLFLFIWMFVLSGVMSGYFLQNRVRLFLHSNARAVIQISLLLLIVWLPVRAALSYAKMAPSLHLYAQLWDERDLFLRQQSLLGARDVVAPSLRRNPALHDIQTTFWIEGDLQDLSGHWINQVAASYYGLASITLHRQR